jgi:hypothetical protein
LASTCCTRSGSAAQAEIGGLDVDDQLQAGWRVQPRLGARRAEDGAGFERLDVERHGSGFQAREVEQLGDEPVQPGDLGVHGAQRRLVGIWHAVHEVLEHRPAAPRAACAARATRWRPARGAAGRSPRTRAHRVEGGGQAGDLVAAAHFDAVAVLAAAAGFGGAGHLPQGRRQPRGEQLDHREREQDRRDEAPAQRQAELGGDQGGDGGGQDRRDDDRRELGLERAEPVEDLHRPGSSSSA